MVAAPCHRHHGTSGSKALRTVGARSGHAVTRPTRECFLRRSSFRRGRCFPIAPTMRRARRRRVSTTTTPCAEASQRLIMSLGDHHRAGDTKRVFALRDDVPSSAAVPRRTSDWPVSLRRTPRSSTTQGRVRSPAHRWREGRDPRERSSCRWRSPAHWDRSEPGAMVDVVLPRGVRRSRQTVWRTGRRRARAPALAAKPGSHPGRQRASVVTGSGPVLVAGASGFVGRRLCEALTSAGHSVRALTRHPENHTGSGTAVYGDVQDAASLQPGLAGCRAAYYLVHSLGSKDFERLDADAARNFARAAADAGIEQIIYLGGLGDDTEHLSSHLRSRREVEGLLGSVRCSGHRAACGDHRRERRHLMGDDPPARRPPARHDHASVGQHEDATDRNRRRRPIPRRSPR